MQSDAPVVSARALMNAQPPPPSAGSVNRLLKRGVQGEDVRAMQQKLHALGFSAPQNGVYDAQTERAVRAFQRSKHLAVDGDAGRQTLTALGFTWGRGASRRETPQTTLPPLQPRRQVDAPQVLSVDSVRNGSLLNSGPSFNDLIRTPVELPHVELPRVEVPALETSPVSASRLGTAAERLALAQRIVVKRGAATQADVDAVVGEVAKLPVGDLRDLQRAGISVVACRDSVVDAVPSLAGVQPRGHAPGRGWQDVPGAYMPGEKAVVIATRGLDDGSRQVPPFNVKHGSVSLVTHEVAHALDAARSYPSNSDPAFSAAYEADLSAGNLLPYYTQPGEAGRSEAYAESLALYLSGDTTGEGARRFPKLMDFWRQTYRGGGA